MRDVFYTILIVWIVMRVLDGISTYGSKKEKGTTASSSSQSSQTSRKTGETRVDYIPPTKKRISDDELVIARNHD